MTLPASRSISRAEPIDLVGAVWSEWPLPRPEHGSDKEVRGQAVVIAGSAEMPGAAVLAGIAALHAGAGKLVIATAASCAAGVAASVPEARVVAIPEAADGGFATEGVQRLRPVLERAKAVLIGPGMQGRASTAEFVAAALAGTTAPVLLDALAMEVPLADLDRRGPLVLTPHAGEMASLCGQSKEAVCERPVEIATDCARRWNAVVALNLETAVDRSPSQGTPAAR